VSAEIVLGILLIPSMGVLGAAIGGLVGTAINNVLPIWQVWSSMKMHPYRWDYWKPALAGIAAAGAAKLVIVAAGVGTGVVAAVAAAGIVGVSYIGFLLLFRLSREDRAAINAISARLRRGTHTVEPVEGSAVE